MAHVASNKYNPCWPTSNKKNTLQLHFIFGHIAFSLSANILRSTEGFSGSPGQLSSKTIEEVTLLQLIVPPTSQEAEQWSFACLLAGLWHMSFMSQVPELLEDPVIIDKGLHHSVVVWRKQTSQTIGLSGTVQQCPFGVLFWATWRSGPVVYLCEVEDVGFMVKHQPRATLVIPINIVDTETWKEKNKKKIF